jgi:hypothetical protein
MKVLGILATLEAPGTEAHGNVPEGQYDRSQARSAWEASLERNVP